MKGQCDPARNEARLLALALQTGKHLKGDRDQSKSLKQTQRSAVSTMQTLPGLKVIKAFPFVVVPSGKIKIFQLHNRTIARSTIITKRHEVLHTNT